MRKMRSTDLLVTFNVIDQRAAIKVMQGTSSIALRFTKPRRDSSEGSQRSSAQEELLV